jgi:hypothetical protein
MKKCGASTSSAGLADGLLISILHPALSLIIEVLVQAHFRVARGPISIIPDHRYAVYSVMASFGEGYPQSRNAMFSRIDGEFSYQLGSDSSCTLRMFDIGVSIDARLKPFPNVVQSARLRLLSVTGGSRVPFADLPTRRLSLH